MSQADRFREDEHVRLAPQPNPALLTEGPCFRITRHNHQHRTVQIPVKGGDEIWLRRVVDIGRTDSRSTADGVQQILVKRRATYDFNQT